MKLKSPTGKHRQQDQNHRLKTAQLTVIIDLPDFKTAESIARSIEPETKTTKGYRSQVKVSFKDSQLSLIIEAEDLVALRAAANSFLHFVAVCLEAVSTVAPFYRGRPRSQLETRGSSF